VKLQGAEKINTLGYKKKKGCTGKSSCHFNSCQGAQFASISLSHTVGNGRKQTCEGCNALPALMDEVKQKCPASSKQEV
jgi:hypothetical protein